MNRNIYTMEENYYYEDNDLYEGTEFNEFENEPGWGSYEEYGGYNGYDDFTIGNAFEGDPEATWNVD